MLSSALLQAVGGLHHSVAALARGELPAEEGRGTLWFHPLDPLACEGRRGDAEKRRRGVAELLLCGTAPPGPVWTELPMALGWPHELQVSRLRTFTKPCVTDRRNQIPATYTVD